MLCPVLFHGQMRSRVVMRTWNNSSHDHKEGKWWLEKLAVITYLSSDHVRCSFLSRLLFISVPNALCLPLLSLHKVRRVVPFRSVPSFPVSSGMGHRNPSHSIPYYPVSSLSILSSPTRSCPVRSSSDASCYLYFPPLSARLWCKTLKTSLELGFDSVL